MAQLVLLPLKCWVLSFFWLAHCSFASPVTMNFQPLAPAPIHNHLSLGALGSCALVASSAWLLGRNLASWSMELNYPPLDSALYPPYPSDMAGSNAMACLGDIRLRGNHVVSWANETEFLVDTYGEGDAGWELIKVYAQLAAGNATNLVHGVASLRDEVREEQSALEREMRVAYGRLAESHRFDSAPGIKFGLVNGTLATAHWACSAVNKHINAVDCAWTAPWAARESDDTIYQALISGLIRIRQSRRSGFGDLEKCSTNVVTSLKASARFAHHNWDRRTLARLDCAMRLGQLECTRRTLAETTHKDLSMGMAAFFGRNARCVDDLHDDRDVLRQARDNGQKVDSWLEKERENAGQGSGEGVQTRTGWERVHEARSQLGQLLDITCVRPVERVE